MPRSDAKLKNLPGEVQAEMWRMRTTYTDEEGRACSPSEGRTMSQEEVRQWLEDVHSISSSAGAFSVWERWFALEIRIIQAKERASQARIAAAKDPDFSSADLEKIGQDVFTAETIEDGNVKAFVELQRLRIKAREQELDERKVVLLERKAKQAEAVEEIMGRSDLSEKEKGVEVRALFGMG